jgi:serine/threonine protein kinase
MLGAGGMGEMSRARDATLGRDVAIKVLPAAFASDPDRLARFEQEARVLASMKFLAIIPQSRANEQPLTVVVNWTAGLAAK